LEARAPRALRLLDLGAVGQAALAADRRRDAHDLVGRALTRLCEIVERFVQLPDDPALAGVEPDAGLAAAAGKQRVEQRLEIRRGNHRAVPISAGSGPRCPRFRLCGHRSSFLSRWTRSVGRGAAWVV